MGHRLFRMWRIGKVRLQNGRPSKGVSHSGLTRWHFLFFIHHLGPSPLFSRARAAVLDALVQSARLFGS